MKKLLTRLYRPKALRSASADFLAVAAGGCFATAGFLWCEIAGFCVLGVSLLVAGWAVDA
jgi:hypothetical protein